MLSSVRRHLSYANVVATMAFVFAMGGGRGSTSQHRRLAWSAAGPHVLTQPAAFSARWLVDIPASGRWARGGSN
jgi:hypothetical protein